MSNPDNSNRRFFKGERVCKREHDFLVVGTVLVDWPRPGDLDLDTMNQPTVKVAWPDDEVPERHHYPESLLSGSEVALLEGVGGKL